MLAGPSSHICSRASCWVILLSILFPSTNVLALNLTPALHHSHPALCNHNKCHASIATSAHVLAACLDSTRDRLSDSASCAILQAAHSCSADVTGKRRNYRKASSQRVAQPQCYRAGIEKTVATLAGNEDVIDLVQTRGLSSVDSMSSQANHQHPSCIISTKSTDRVAITRMNGHSDGHVNHWLHCRQHSMDTNWSTDSEAHTDRRLPASEQCRRDNADSVDETNVLWQGCVYATEKGTSDRSLPLTGPILKFPQTRTQLPLPQAPWLGLIQCSLQSLDHLLTAAELGATAAILYSTSLTHEDRSMCLSRLVEERQEYMTNHEGSVSLPIFMLDHMMTDRLDVILTSLESSITLSSRMLSMPNLVNQRSMSEIEHKSSFGPESAVGSNNLPRPRAAMPSTVSKATDLQSISLATPFARTTAAVYPRPGPALESVSAVHSQYRRDIVVQSAARRFVHKVASFSPARVMQDTLLLVRDDSITGKLAMILMSTICGVGVGMFGALVFVVVLKVRLFQARRRSYPSQARTTSQRHSQAQWQTAGPKLKRVVPKSILDSFGIQTVLEASTTVVLTPADTTNSGLAAALLKAKSKFAANDMEMEEGFEDTTARDDARQGLRNRTSRPFPRATAAVTAGSDSAELHHAPTEEEWDGVIEGEEMDEAPMVDFDATRRGSLRHTEPHTPINPTGTRMMKHGSCTANHTPTEDKKQQAFTNANEQTMCSICLMEYEVGDQVRTLPCFHQYHASCIDPWLLHITSLCPICKRDHWPSHE
ncbi:hypothetical protein B0O80DRAFT_471373 [Mortierella sp. GBAus27b]|nr:hypothetical protein B0O80DRAFT_471373 [Mortierella sp. GBAus27b]